jgi:hypothetical protein
MLWAVVALAASWAFAGEGQPQDTPAALLKRIQALASDGKYDALEKEIYPLVVDEDSARELAIKGIKTKKKRGDFAYSPEALDELIKKHVQRIQPISEKLLRRLFGEGDEFARDPKLKAISKERPKDIYALDYKDVHILMVKAEDKFQLVFWENLPKILKAEDDDNGDDDDDEEDNDDDDDDK